MVLLRFERLSTRWQGATVLAMRTQTVSIGPADDMKGLGISEEPFENEMVCYPFVVEDNGRRLMFYNGNGFGQGGLVLPNG